MYIAYDLTSKTSISKEIQHDNLVYFTTSLTFLYMQYLYVCSFLLQDAGHG